MAELQIGDEVELINEVLGSPIGTRGKINEINGDEIEIQLKPYENTVTLKARVGDIKKSENI